MIPLKDDNPTRRFPFVTLFFIALNAAVFLLQLILGPARAEVFVYRTAAIPYEITTLHDIYPQGIVPPPLTLLTAMFVHAGLFHLLGNMLYLWIFGDNIEDTLGHFRFILFYLFTGAAASMTHIIANPGATVPLIGASGAIAGVLGAYFMLFPRAKVLTLAYFLFFAQVIRIPAIVFLGIWFLFQIISSYMGGAGGGIAWYAHIGGFIAGAIIALFVKRTGGRRAG
ncbi:MAG: rhomboid family intramembrane serine protease [Deltaproteobacteria bacterium]|nr:rhomboid family intramembrane serine protease [Deltaproteobacteria bacterium]